MKLIRIFTTVLLALVIAGCTNAVQRDNRDRQMTVGLVQKEIREGMSQVEVAQVLGSPNLVTRDRDGRESWIYDKISTQSVRSSSSGGVGGLILGIPIAAGAGGGFGGSSASAATRQKTLTIIIKFREGVVDEFSYNQSSF